MSPISTTVLNTFDTHIKLFSFIIYFILFGVCGVFENSPSSPWLHENLSCKFGHILPVYGSAGDAFLLRVLHELCIFTDSVLLVDQRVKGLHVWIQYTQ